MTRFDNYFSDARLLFKSSLKGERKGQPQGSFIFSRTDVGICSAYSVLGLPICTIQFNPNFKKKLYVCGVPLWSWSRAPLVANQGCNYKQDSERKPRIYIHIGGLPYFDNRSGIPRVAKKLTEEGLKHPNVDVFPVYPDPRDGTYRIALSWIKKMGYPDPHLNGRVIDEGLSDPAMTIQEGDWFIHTMINPNELDFEEAQLQAIREAGVKIGFILHDIIAERHPEYFKNRDGKNFSRWLRKIDKYDGIFPISKATTDDYVSWRKEQGLKPLDYPLKWFHLGADFKTNQGRLKDGDKEWLSVIAKNDYYIQVSTIEPRKGYEQLLNAFDCLWNEGSELGLVFVGRKGWLVNELCQRIKKHPQLNKKFFWLSGVSDELLTALYSNAKGVIVASENEGFGLSVAEGAFYGKPLLLRDIPVFREIAGDGAFFFDGLDAKDLAEKIKEFDVLLSSQSISLKLTNEVKVASWSECFSSFYRML